MDVSRILEGDLQARDLRLVILASRYNERVVDALVRGAIDALRRAGLEERKVELVRVPGAFELPLVARRLAMTRRYDAIIALGAVIRGETGHYDFVAGEACGGLARVATETGVPVALGLLTTETTEQALERSGGKAGNKGAEAALCAVELANLLRRIEA